MEVKTSKRYEIKMVLNQIQLTYFYSWMYANTTARTSFPSRRINSIYFDDLDLTSASDNLIGISDRKKARLRYYGCVEDICDNLVFEVKSKSSRLGYKNICSLPNLNGRLDKITYHAVGRILYDEIIGSGLFDVARLFDRCLNPILKVAYDREYYETLEKIRITVEPFAKLNNEFRPKRFAHL